MEAATALARQLRQAAVLGVDGRAYGKTCAGAGQKPDTVALTSADIYGEIVKATNAPDKKEMPDSDLACFPANSISVRKIGGLAAQARSRSGCR
jgi:hypothetical protein